MCYSNTNPLTGNINTIAIFCKLSVLTKQKAHFHLNLTKKATEGSYFLRRKMNLEVILLTVCLKTVMSSILTNTDKLTDRPVFHI